MMLRETLLLCVLASLCPQRVHTVIYTPDDITVLAVNEDVYWNVTRDGRTQDDILNVTIHDGPLYPYTSDFELLVRQSHIFIDKTLFLRELLLTPHKNIILTYPRKWGKSINIDMIRHFLQMEVDWYGNKVQPRSKTESYRMFVYGYLRLNHTLRKPLLISRYKKFVDEHLGQYPVISLDLFFTNLVSREAFEYRLGWSLMMAYRNHDYLMDVFQQVINDTSSTDKQKQEAQDNYDLFETFKLQQADQETIPSSIRWLSEQLHKHFNRTVVLLLDDYDYFINYLVIAYRKPDRDELMQYYLNFLKTTMIDNPHIERTIAAGIMSIAKTMAPDLFGHFHDYFYLDGWFSSYFGYHEREIRFIQDYVNLSPGNRTVMDEWCNGLKVNLSSPRKMYNPQPVNQFIERGAPDFPWNPVVHWLMEALLPYFMQVPGYEAVALNPLIAQLEVVIPKFMKIPGFEEIWGSVLTEASAYTAKITDTLQFTYNHWKIIEDAIANPGQNVQQALDTVFHYLFANAQLTWVDYRLLTSPMATVFTLKPPNKEAQLRLKVLTAKYYGNDSFGFTRPKITNYSLWIESNLTNFINTDNISPQKLCVRVFEQFISEAPAFFEADSESSYPVYPWFELPYASDGNPRENSVRSMVRCAFAFGWTSRIHSTGIFPPGPTKPDLFITQAGRAAIIKIKYDERLDGAIKDTDIDGYVDTSHARLIGQSEHFKHVQSVKFIAIQVRASRRVVIKGWTEKID